MLVDRPTNVVALVGDCEASVYHIRIEPYTFVGAVASAVGLPIGFSVSCHRPSKPKSFCPYPPIAPRRMIPAASVVLKNSPRPALGVNSMAPSTPVIGEGAESSAPTEPSRFSAAPLDPRDTRAVG